MPEQTEVQVRTIEPVRVPAILWALAALAVVLLYVVLQDNGAVLASGASWLHELAHDGRHLLGVPCH